MVTATELRERLADTALPADPTNVEMPEGSDRWPADMREHLLSSLKLAGVLIPVVDRGDTDLSLLLTRRSEGLKHHAGQVSFPGGRMEADDTTIVDTALRETWEEIGIARSAVDVIGYLRPMPTITGYAVTPVVGVVPGDIELAVDRNEVELAFEVPLGFLLDPANRRYVEREFFGGIATMVEYHYAGQRVWGATAFIIQKLLKIIKNN
jgi:8-oxo-dGTP pyrophosphatase MutT (NUDIX family)